mmetsp:Transcript_17849/g.54576  ORF Transcript_17849/g.54576 Transcript_17849/m.54576 type:complete len:230 (-) Transcript_17849:1823-2512(-)
MAAHSVDVSSVSNGSCSGSCSSSTQRRDTRGLQWGRLDSTPRRTSRTRENFFSCQNSNATTATPTAFTAPPRVRACTPGPWTPAEGFSGGVRRVLAVKRVVAARPSHNAFGAPTAGPTEASKSKFLAPPFRRLGGWRRRAARLRLLWGPGILSLSKRNFLVRWRSTDGRPHHHAGSLGAGVVRPSSSIVSSSATSACSPVTALSPTKTSPNSEALKSLCGCLDEAKCAP